MARDSKGRFTKKKTRRNLDAFVSGGVVHPVRKSANYKPERTTDQPKGGLTLGQIGDRESAWLDIAATRGDVARAKAKAGYAAALKTGRAQPDAYAAYRVKTKTIEKKQLHEEVLARNRKHKLVVKYDKAHAAERIRADATERERVAALKRDYAAAQAAKAATKAAKGKR
ncbi:MAG: hypothetical protein Q7O66_05945 [Dehalococcoidia bacterium]|nr:hypothetical protein [Dehalococcoidia bacterium]